MIFGLLTFILSLASSNAQSLHEKYYYGNCYIFNEKLTVVRSLIGGSLCLPLADGGWIATDTDLLYLRRYDRIGNILWNIPGYFHHQLRLDTDQDLLVLGSENKNNVRYDTIEKRSLKTGQLLKRFSLMENWETFKAWPGPFPPNLSNFAPNLQKSLKVSKEFSHLNSIYPIPKNVKNKFNHASYVINDTNRGICFAIDSHFKKILWSQNTRTDEGKSSHDCQILEDGSLLYLDNAQFLNSESTYQIRHLQGKVSIIDFPKDKEDQFPGDNRGGIEKESGGYIISVSQQYKKTQIGRITDKGQWIVRKTIPFPLQDLKPLPHSDYLLKNQLR